MRILTLTSLALGAALLAATIAPRIAAAGDAGAAADSTTAARRPALPGPPLLLDTAELGSGATVVFTRIPGPAEVHDLQYLEVVSHVLLQLPAWPEDVDALQPLAQAVLPEGADLVVVLPGYPESRAQAEAWNLLRRPVRIIMVVTSPPVDREMIYRMNAIHGLERVIADLDRPSRAGFERLQRPLSYRVVMP